MSDLKDGVKKGAKVAGKVIKWVLIAVLAIIVIVVAYSCYACSKVTSAAVDVTKAVVDVAKDSALVKDAVRDATGGEDKTKMASEAIAVTAVNLYNEYESNALRADNSYKGKFVRVTGKVSKVDQDLLTKKPYVKLFSDPSNPYMDYVSVYFKESESSRIADLENGQNITIVGLCEGKSVMSVNIKDSFFE